MTVYMFNILKQNKPSDEEDYTDQLAETAYFDPEDEDDYNCYSYPPTTQAKAEVSSFSWLLVSVVHLLQLFKFCPTCGAAILTVSSSVNGFCTTIRYVCSGIPAHRSSWYSCDYVKRYSVANVIIPSASSLCGFGFADLAEWCKTIRLPCVSSATYYRNVKTWLYPCISKMYLSMRSAAQERYKGKSIVISGDGQFDSPGFSAKYCCYTIMDTTAGNVIDFFVVQRGQYQGELEKHACREVLTKISTSMNVTRFVTDRHMGIAKMMRDCFPKIEHAFDVWHVARSLKKKLNKLGKKYESVKPWIKPIVNHFWFSCENCKGNADLLMQIFHSVLMHVSKHHTWKSASTLNKFKKFIDPKKPYPRPFTLVKQCFHKQVNMKKGRAIPWLNKDSPEFGELVKIVCNTRLCNDMKLCKSYLHTGQLENMHSVKNKYLPKRKHYSMETTIVKMMQLAIETNLHASNTDGKVRVYVEYSRAAADWVLKKHREKDTVTYKRNLLKDTQSALENGQPHILNLEEYILKPLPKNMYPINTHKPSKQDMIKKQKSRFK